MTKTPILAADRAVDATHMWVLLWQRVVAIIKTQRQKYRADQTRP